MKFYDPWNLYDTRKIMETRPLVDQIKDYQRELRTQLKGYYFPEVPEIKCTDISRKIPEICALAALQKRSDIIMIDEAITIFEKEGAGMSYTVRKFAHNNGFKGGR